ncbi:disulfide bond formation protein B [Paracoccus sp. (in: a-proteobacteria)]|uniref:disulfide bond formation protein B n=1 Tax=Paracoccus sp. TaxID=267 RepID=UPI0026DF0977|nr:disulfide bond formation protein B [Paracoccus sp. (in: a-proteobacteria)]MDO5647387.1 disulfide bond formation protein B [Paracoccus sp. (in: a-proteobacteria)]
MNARQFTALAGAGSAFLLIGALGFQAAGYAPCPMCILQRWPHLAAVVIAAAIWATGWLRAGAVLGVVAALVATGLAVQHVGVEQGWWAGPTTCSSGIGDLARMSAQDLMARLQTAPVIRCDEVAWSLFGISMAGWNALFSAGLVGVWSLALWRSR